LGSPAAGQGPAHLQRIRIALMSETTEIPHSFEAALTELENLVGRMESGDLPLQESLAVYKRGAELLAYCQNALKDAELQVQVLEKGLLQPFQPDDASNG
jgi:exodeoxyribonuclease VII small subunit